LKSQRLALVTKVNDCVLLVHDQVPYFLGGVPVSQVNRTIIERCLEGWLFLLEDLMLRLGYSDEARIDRTNNFVQTLIRVDFTEILDYLDSVSMYLISTGAGIDGFKHLQCPALDGSFVEGRLLSPINGAIYSFFLENEPSKKAHFLAIALQFLKYPLKLELQDIGLEEQALEKYLEIEDELATMKPIPLDLENSISRIIGRWFKDFHIGNLRPAHGPGSVAEGPLTLATKFEKLGCDAVMKIALRNHSFPNSYTEYYPYQPLEGIVRTSRTIFVPKTASKLRTISMEPVSLQYIQQGVMKEIYDFIERHPYLGVRIRLRDQGQNQILAWEGSLRGNYCTIDLSHASDSVSWDLVRRVFKTVPHLYRWLLATRSTSTLLPDGTTRRLLKYAPMGSALCFPVECIIFAALVEHTLGQGCTHRAQDFPVYSVYGDDLVVPTGISEELLKVLSLCGFAVNVRKTHCTGSYRESCGREYYAGVDISVLAYRTPFYKSRVSPSAYGSWCSGANNAYFHHLPLYRWYLITKILSTRRSSGPYFGYSPECSPQLFSIQPTNFHVRKRWSKRYQRWEGRFTLVKSRPRGGELEDDTLAYFSKLVEMAWRPTCLGPRLLDESAPPIAMQGCVEFFSSTTAPIIPFIKHSVLSARDWDGT